MSRGLMYALVLPLLGVECWAQFVAHDQQFTTLFAVLVLGVIAVRWVLGTAETCPPNCPKCAESESLEGDR